MSERCEPLPAPQGKRDAHRPQEQPNPGDQARSTLGELQGGQGERLNKGKVEGYVHTFKEAIAQEDYPTDSKTDLETTPGGPLCRRCLGTEAGAASRWTAANGRATTALGGVPARLRCDRRRVSTESKSDPASIWSVDHWALAGASRSRCDSCRRPNTSPCASTSSRARLPEWAWREALASGLTSFGLTQPGGALTNRAEAVVPGSGDRRTCPRLQLAQPQPSIRPRDQVTLSHHRPGASARRRRGRQAGAALFPPHCEHRLQGAFMTPVGSSVAGLKGPAGQPHQAGIQGFHRLQAPPASQRRRRGAQDRTTPHGAVPGLRVGIAAVRAPHASSGSAGRPGGQKQAAQGASSNVVSAPQGLLAWTRVRGAGLLLAFDERQRAGGPPCSAVGGQQQQAGPENDRGRPWAASPTDQRRRDPRMLDPPIARPAQACAMGRQLRHEHPEGGTAAAACGLGGRLPGPRVSRNKPRRCSLQTGWPGRRCRRAMPARGHGRERFGRSPMPTDGRLAQEMPRRWQALRRRLPKPAGPLIRPLRQTLGRSEAGRTRRVRPRAPLSLAGANCWPRGRSAAAGVVDVEHFWAPTSCMRSV